MWGLRGQRKRGRRLGSKNKTTLARLGLAVPSAPPPAPQTETTECGTIDSSDSVTRKRKRGRALGSKNKETLARLALAMQYAKSLAPHADTSLLYDTLAPYAGTSLLYDTLTRVVKKRGRPHNAATKQEDRKSQYAVVLGGRAGEDASGGAAAGGSLLQARLSDRYADVC